MIRSIRSVERFCGAYRSPLTCAIVGIVDLIKLTPLLCHTCLLMLEGIAALGTVVSPIMTLLS